MNNESKRHHYLPQFYIKKFRNANGTIYINDKEDSSDYNNINSKFPKTIFFEWNRNTFEVDNEQNTVIEKIYRDIEGKIAPHLDKLMKSKSTDDVYIIDVEILRNLIYLGYLTKWRVPRNDSYVDELNSSLSFDDLNLFAKIETDVYSLNEAWPNALVPEIKRLIFPTLLFNRKDDYAKVFKNTFVINFEEPLFLTDNPFVELSIDEEKEFPSFIFPISSFSLLVYCDLIDKHEFVKYIVNNKSADKYLKYLYNCTQITLMWQASKYIGCESKEYLEYYLSIVTEVSDQIGDVSPFIAFNALANFKTFVDNGSN